MSPNISDANRNDGFALLVVLWTLVAISFLTALIIASGGTELRIAGNLYANAVAAAAAEGAVDEAIFRLSNPGAPQAWQIDGGAYELSIGAGRVLLRIENEAKRINPNSAPPTVLEGLLRATGSDAAVSRRLSTAIAEWVGVAFAGRTQAIMATEYRAAGLNYAPPGQPLAKIGDLERVLDMTTPVLAAIRPHLTVYGPPVSEVTTGDPAVAAALDFARKQPGGLRISIAADRPGAARTARIAAIAYGPNNAEVTRAAVVRFDPSLPRGAVILAWGASID